MTDLREKYPLPKSVKPVSLTDCKEIKDTSINFAISSKDKDKVIEDAIISGLSLSDYIRKQLGINN